jgi:hypothetical protein
MRIDFLGWDAAVEELADEFDVFCDFSGKKLAAFALFVVWPGKLDDRGIVEVANFFKAGLEDIPPNVAIDLGQGFQLIQDGVAYGSDIKLVIGFIE